MQTVGVQLEWFAVRTASGREKAVAAQFQKKGLDEFLPLFKSRRQWSDRTKELLLPLFPGYLFCRFRITERLPVLMTPGVKLIAGYGKTPAPVSEAEIESLRRAAASGADTMPWPFLTAGQRVRIKQGAMAGVEGILLEVKNSCRIILSVDLLRRSVAVEVDRATVVPVFTRSVTMPDDAGISRLRTGNSQAAFNSAV